MAILDLTKIFINGEVPKAVKINYKDIKEKLNKISIEQDRLLKLKEINYTELNKIITI